MLTLACVLLFSSRLIAGTHLCVPLATGAPTCAITRAGMTLAHLIVQLCSLANAATDPVFLQVHVPITVDGRTVNATATCRSDDPELELATTSMAAARRFCRRHALLRDESGSECENAVGTALLLQLKDRLAAKSGAAAGAAPSTPAANGKPYQQLDMEVLAHRWLWFVPRPGGTFNQLDQLWEAAQLAVALQRTLVLPLIAPSKHTGSSRQTDGIPFESLWSLQHMDGALRRAVAATGGAGSSGCNGADCETGVGAATNAQFVRDCGGVAHFGGATGFDRFGRRIFPHTVRTLCSLIPIHIFRITS